MELAITKQQAEQYYVTHPNHSFAMICISEAGDLFINGDWGQSNFAWRVFAQEKTLLNFKRFLVDINSGYWKSKMQYNMAFMDIKKVYIKRFVDNTWPIFEVFQQQLEKELAEIKPQDKP